MLFSWCIYKQKKTCKLERVQVLASAGAACTAAQAAHAGWPDTYVRDYMQAYGDEGYGARVTHSASLAIHFEQRIKASDGAYVLSHPRSFVNVCFWWVPPALRPFQAATASQQDAATLDKVRHDHH